MFKKVHLRLTLLFTLFSTLILLVMSFLYLYINYRTLDNNSYITYKMKDFVDIWAFCDIVDCDIIFSY